MSITQRQYVRADFTRVSEFLIANHRQGNGDGNWLQPAWEYMHTHPNLDESALGLIGIWEDEGQVVGAAHCESGLGEAFFQLHPDYTQLKPDMLAHAERLFRGKTERGEWYLNAFVNDFDPEFESMVKSLGYKVVERYNRPMSEFTFPRPFPEIELPEGYQIKSLADENNLRKINRVLWRGFNHPGEPPDEELEGRKKMQSGPSFRKELTIVVVEPGGDFVSFCGMWFEPVNRYAYVEPAATDPDYRCLGLGKAAVWEGIRRCKALGAEAAYVGSDQSFYQAIGFTKRFDSRCWAKLWPA